jgi:hypothetical protein
MGAQHTQDCTATGEAFDLRLLSPISTATISDIQVGHCTDYHSSDRLMGVKVAEQKHAKEANPKCVPQCKAEGGNDQQANNDSGHDFFLFSNFIRLWFGIS